MPLISWVQAGEWNNLVDTFQPGDAEIAQLLRRIALAGGRCLVEECQGPVLDALIAQDPQAFARRVEAETEARCIVLKPGETTEY